MPGIVVGVDGSTAAAQALEWALRAAEARNQPLTVVAVVPTPLIAGWAPGTAYEPANPEDLADARKAVTELLERLRAEHPDSSVEVEVRVHDGVPAEVLLRYTEEADQLVVGSRGIGGFKRLMLGSVSTVLVQHATCPVTVVPHDRSAGPIPRWATP